MFEILQAKKLISDTVLTLKGIRNNDQVFDFIKYLTNCVWKEMKIIEKKTCTILVLVLIMHMLLQKCSTWITKVKKEIGLE